jgi:hypothetical protein
MDHTKLAAFLQAMFIDHGPRRKAHDCITLDQCSFSLDETFNISADSFQKLSGFSTFFSIHLICYK